MNAHISRHTATATAVFAILLAGCSSSPADKPTPTDHTRTTSAAPKSPNDQASANAEQLLRQFYFTLDHLRQDPSKSLDLLENVASSTELSAYRRLIKAERKQGVHQVGKTSIAQLEVQAVDLDNSDPSAGKVPTVQIDVCYDVNDTDVLDANGKSIVESGRADTGWVRHTVANYEWDADPDGGWRVATSQDIEREPCAA